jgi:AraC-like DNA-binding protein
MLAACRNEKRISCNEMRIGSLRRCVTCASSGECRAERVAAMFAVHRVTLHRYLRQDGTTFEALLDEIRRDLAVQMLDITNLAVGEIAAALGYGASGSFVRAFNRWHGRTPGAWRSRKPAVGRAAARDRGGRRGR